MLMVLLGSGNGLSNGVASNFKNRAKNTMLIWSEKTTIPYAGLKPGRRFNYKTQDYNDLKALKGVRLITGRYYLGARTFAAGKEYADYSIVSCHPDYKEIEGYVITKGRFINEIDIRQKRKSLLIGVDMEKALFQNEDPIGKMVKVGNIPFTVVGIYDIDNQRSGSREGLIPITTAQALFNANDRIHGFSLTANEMSKTENMALEQQIWRILAANHRVHPDDQAAIGIYNTLKDYANTMAIFTAINMFIWMIGIGTLIAGLVGVSNIMLISVKERTKEFGIRKAIGASPRSIVGLVLLEAVLITSVAGYVGMLLGVGLMEAISLIMEKNRSSGGGMSLFLNPTVDLNIAISAMLLLIGAGSLAGYIPAKQAASVKPIEALHNE
jgi:putative ABC transport system permease protein